MTTEVASMAKETTLILIQIMFKAVEASLLPLVWITEPKESKFKMMVATARSTNDPKVY